MIFGIAFAGSPPTAGMQEAASVWSGTGSCVHTDRACPHPTRLPLGPRVAASSSNGGVSAASATRSNPREGESDRVPLRRAQFATMPTSSTMTMHAKSACTMLSAVSSSSKLAWRSMTFREGWVRCLILLRSPTR